MDTREGTDHFEHTPSEETTGSMEMILEQEKT